MKKSRAASPFGLAFLDIMACGFGAVTLLFLILRHNSDIEVRPDPNLLSEVNFIEQDIRDAQENRAQLLNSLAVLEDSLVEAQGEASRVVDILREKRDEQSIQSDPDVSIDKLRKDVEQLEQEIAELEEGGFSDKLRDFTGQGDRQYLTGLKLGGERIVILLDASASMLDDTIVNAIRRRNMDDDSKRRAPKWQWALRTTEWLIAQMPASARYQVIVFNTHAKTLRNDGEWLDAADSFVVDETVAELKNVVPAYGTSLYHAFEKLKQLSPLPDNLFLLTDGLPTQGKTKPSGRTVSEQRRYNLFNDAVKILPDIPVNVILFPMEGDPRAAVSYWILGTKTQGAFLAPSRDWP
jgi:hypothetical protein